MENWNSIAMFFKYPEEIKKMIYITNAVESLHRQFRKVTKAKILLKIYRKNGLCRLEIGLLLYHNYPLFLMKDLLNS
jgi:hypothetical protein